MLLYQYYKEKFCLGQLKGVKGFNTRGQQNYEQNKKHVKKCN